MSRSSRLVLRTHAAFLVALTIALTVGGHVGLQTGAGPFSWLQESPVALPGLMQAYLLMLLVGVSMWLGADGPRPWRWSLVAIAAHCVPLLALATSWDVLEGTGALATVGASFAIHGGWIAAETVSLALGARRRPAGSPGGLLQGAGR